MNSSSLHPWPVLRGLLLELSSYEVPKVVDHAGFMVDWALSSQQDYSDKMRIAAYRPRIDAAYEQLQEEEKVRVAYIIAGELADRGLGEKMDASLRAIGWRIENGKLAPDSEPVRELFFPKQSQHDAYVEIRRILQTAAQSISVVDPYMDQTMLTLLTTSLRPKMAIRLLTSKLPEDFEIEAKKWRAQHPEIALEVRTTKAFHDRFVVIDEGECWHIGCSIKDAGNKAFMLSNIEDEGNCRALVAQIEVSWQEASTFLEQKFNK
jgi:hypothetical protein